MKISYVITVYNKTAFLHDVITSLAAEHKDPLDAAEYIFVDDGSSDESVAMIRQLSNQLPWPVVIIEQPNQGAAAATNAGVNAAQYEWIRLLDGDDLVCRESTRILYETAQKSNTEFVMGSYGFFTQKQDILPQIPFTKDDFELIAQEDAIFRYIKNFPNNSSCMLIKKSLFDRMGGSDIRLISPDYTLCTRAVVHSPALALLKDHVCLMVDEAAGRLSSQKGRSRYESILAIYYMAHEMLPHRLDVAQAVYKRACSRSYNYAKFLKNSPLKHGVRYAFSKIMLPRDLKEATLKCLSAYTPDQKIERPEHWKPATIRILNQKP